MDENDNINRLINPYYATDIVPDLTDEHPPLAPNDPSLPDGYSEAD